MAALHGAVIVDSNEAVSAFEQEDVEEPVCFESDEEDVDGDVVGGDAEREADVDDEFPEDIEEVFSHGVEDLQFIEVVALDDDDGDDACNLGTALDCSTASLEEGGSSGSAGQPRSQEGASGSQQFPRVVSEQNDAQNTPSAQEDTEDYVPLGSEEPSQKELDLLSAMRRHLRGQPGNTQNADWQRKPVAMMRVMAPRRTSTSTDVRSDDVLPDGKEVEEAIEQEDERNIPHQQLDCSTAFAAPTPSRQQPDLSYSQKNNEEPEAAAEDYSHSMAKGFVGAPRQQTDVADSQKNIEEPEAAVEDYSHLMAKSKTAGPPPAVPPPPPPKTPPPPPPLQASMFTPQMLGAGQASAGMVMGWRPGLMFSNMLRPPPVGTFALPGHTGFVPSWNHPVVQRSYEAIAQQSSALSLREQALAWKAANEAGEGAHQFGLTQRHLPSQDQLSDVGAEVQSSQNSTEPQSVPPPVPAEVEESPLKRRRVTAAPAPPIPQELGPQLPDPPRFGLLPPRTSCRRCRKSVTARGGVFCGRPGSPVHNTTTAVVGCGAAICWRCMRRAPHEDLGKVRTTKAELQSRGLGAWWMHEICFRITTRGTLKQQAA